MHCRLSLFLASQAALHETGVFKPKKKRASEKRCQPFPAPESLIPVNSLDLRDRTFSAGGGGLGHIPC